MPSNIAQQFDARTEGFFESRVLIIAVGPDKTPLNVYADALKQTAFFEVEGQPLSENEKALREPVERQLTSTRNEPDITISDSLKVEDNPTGVKCTSSADYYLYQQEKRILQPRAFKLFLLFLYHTAPGPPKDRDDCRGMLQAYCLAKRYRCAYIQNQIIDRFRQYHCTICVKFDDLVWLINRLGDNKECLMIAYLVDQIAYEIAKEGLSTFKDTNPFLEVFLATGNRGVRVALFEALASHAQHTKMMDPAKTGKNWHTTTDTSQQE